MMRVATIEHAPYEGPGAVATWARDRGHELRRTDATGGVFPVPDDYDFLVVMGGPMGAGDDASLDWLTAEKRAVRAGIDAGKHVFGVCLGAQIVANVLGAAVTRNPELEIGWFPVTMTAAGQASRVFGTLPQAFIAGHWHGDTFSIPESATRIASSAACANQAFEFDGGRVVGVQFHLEWWSADVEALVANCGADVVPAAHVASSAAFLAGEREHGASARAILHSLLDGIVG